jgi:thioredoxin 1
MSEVITFTDGNFDQEVLKSEMPVLVDFYAPWCAPCLRVAPIVQEIAKEFGDNIKVGKINVDENNQIAMDYQIQSIPTLMIFKNGEMVERVIGAVNKASIAEAIGKHIGEGN